MKTQAEVEDAVKLLTLQLTGQVKLDPPLDEEQTQQLLVAVRTLMWALDLPSPSPLRVILDKIEQSIEQNGLNPHQALVE